MVAVSELVARLGGTLEGGRDARVVDVDLDSRRVGEDFLFCALPGHREDGARFVADAVARGASAVLAPGASREVVSRVAPDASLWIHDAARRVAGDAASLVHGEPSRKLFTIAVTGTNGKTTVAHLAAQLLAAAGRRAAVVGTVGNRILGASEDEVPNTTPDATLLHRLCARHLAAGGDAFVTEASSHALVQDRLAGFDVDVAVFTNLTRDHLDYHGDMAGYETAKARLFESLRPGSHAVLPVDDPVAERFAAIARERGAAVHTYGIGARGDLRATRVVVEPGGITTFLDGMGISWESFLLPLVGRHNLANALAALAAVLVSGASPSALRSGLATVSPPTGRLEEVQPQGTPFRVLVDFAHTPDALRAVLEALRAELDRAGRGRLVCLFGCGGDKDKGKRPIMGGIAQRFSDVVVLTSDNPRSEDPLAIVEQARAGMDGSTEVLVEPDRRRAIELALGLAREGDVVLLAGKGHETTQEVAGVRTPFREADIVREVLA
ncbi:MAG: UDP-N-acetylmuramoyl-L-alanyl-D-glutamate--2,6-diaminopimelate ligase [Planctomycetota bacterium]